MSRLPKTLTVLRDNREKLPARFPAVLGYWHGGQHRLARVVTEDVVLKTGDYALKTYADLALVERKGSFTELLECFENGRRKQFLGKNGQVERLLRSKYPILVLDINPTGLYDKTWMDHPEYMLDRVIQLQHQHPRLSVQWFWAGQGQNNRLLLGEFILRQLWQAVLKELTDG